MLIRNLTLLVFSCIMFNKLLFMNGYPKQILNHCLQKHEMFKKIKQNLKCFSTLSPLYLNNVNQNYNTFQSEKSTTHSKPQPCLLQTLQSKYNDKTMKRHHILKVLEFSKNLKLSMMSLKHLSHMRG